MRSSFSLSKYYSWTQTPASSPTSSVKSPQENTLMTSPETYTTKIRPSSPTSSEDRMEKLHHRKGKCIDSDDNIDNYSDDDDDDDDDQDRVTEETADDSIMHDDRLAPSKATLGSPEKLFSPPKQSFSSTKLAQHDSGMKSSKRPRREYGFHQNPHQPWQHYCDTGAQELLSILEQQRQLNLSQAKRAPQTKRDMRPPAIPSPLRQTSKNAAHFSSSNMSAAHRMKESDQEEDQEVILSLNEYYCPVLNQHSLSHDTHSKSRGIHIQQGAPATTSAQQLPPACGPMQTTKEQQLQHGPPDSSSQRSSNSSRSISDNDDNTSDVEIFFCTEGITHVPFSPLSSSSYPWLSPAISPTTKSPHNTNTHSIHTHTNNNQFKAIHTSSQYLEQRQDPPRAFSQAQKTPPRDQPQPFLRDTKKRAMSTGQLHSNHHVSDQHDKARIHNHTRDHHGYHKESSKMNDSRNSKDRYIPANRQQPSQHDVTNTPSNSPTFTSPFLFSRMMWESFAIAPTTTNSAATSNTSNSSNNTETTSPPHPLRRSLSAHFKRLGNL